MPRNEDFDGSGETLRVILDAIVSQEFRILAKVDANQAESFGSMQLVQQEIENLNRSFFSLKKDILAMKGEQNSVTGSSSSNATVGKPKKIAELAADMKRHGLFNNEDTAENLLDAQIITLRALTLQGVPRGEILTSLADNFNSSIPHLPILPLTPGPKREVVNLIALVRCPKKLLENIMNYAGGAQGCRINRSAKFHTLPHKLIFPKI